ncbi:hypothetical protein [Blastococcus sp. SYSU D00695]
MSRTLRPVVDAVGEVATAGVAVASVSAVIARLVAENVAGAARRALSPRGHVPAVRPALAGRLHTVVAEARAVAERHLGPWADALLPQAAAAVLSRLDVAGLVERFVDVDRIAAQLDVDAVAARLDVDRVVDRVDVDAIAAGLDLDDIVARVDITRVIDRLDLDDIVARVDITRVIDRLDLDDIVARVDITRVVDRLDLDDIVARVDIDPVIERAHVVELARYVVQEIDLPGLIRSSTSALSSDVVRGVRDQGAEADRAVERVVDRLLMRRHGRHDGAPERRP